MWARILALGLAALVVLSCTAPRTVPEIPTQVEPEDPSDGGLLDPQWFGSGLTWSTSWRADFLWARPDTRLAPPLLYLEPWEEPRFLSPRSPMDYAAGWEGAEFLQDLLRDRLHACPGLTLASTPEQTPYHARGRMVEATSIRQGASSSLGILAGLPTFTWDFKVVDTRTGEPLLASHHRSIAAPASTWVAALEGALERLTGQPPSPPWERPADSRELEDGSWMWMLPGLRLGPGSLALGPWAAHTDTGGMWKAWTNGMGASLALGVPHALQARAASSGLLGQPGRYLLRGQVFSTPKYLKVRYRATLTEADTGKVVARFEIRSPMGFPASILEQVADQILSPLEKIREPGPALSSQAVPPPPHPPVPAPQAPAASPDWEGLGQLRPVSGPVDKAWARPGLDLKGRTLWVADWEAPALPAEVDAHSRLVAWWISRRSPAWLYGALAFHGDRGFRLARDRGDLRLEGRVVHLDQPDTGRFSTAFAGALSLGLATQAEGTLQLRLKDARTGETLALVEQHLVSFQMASDGIPYKAFKWLAEDFVSWLLATGTRPPPSPRPPE